MFKIRENSIHIVVYINAQNQRLKIVFEMERFRSIDFNLTFDVVRNAVSTCHKCKYSISTNITYTNLSLKYIGIILI